MLDCYFEVVQLPSLNPEGQRFGMAFRLHPSTIQPASKESCGRRRCPGVGTDPRTECGICGSDTCEQRATLPETHQRPQGWPYEDRWSLWGGDGRKFVRGEVVGWAPTKGHLWGRGKPNSRNGLSWSWSSEGCRDSANWRWCDSCRNQTSFQKESFDIPSWQSGGTSQDCLHGTFQEDCCSEGFVAGTFGSMKNWNWSAVWEVWSVSVRSLGFDSESEAVIAGGNSSHQLTSTKDHQLSMMFEWELFFGCHIQPAHQQYLSPEAHISEMFKACSCPSSSCGDLWILCGSLVQQKSGCLYTWFNLSCSWFVAGRLQSIAAAQLQVFCSWISNHMFLWFSLGHLVLLRGLQLV